MNNKNYYFSNASVNDRINKEKININDGKIKDINSIYDICKHIAENKQDSEVNVLLAEELSELIKAIMKLERFYMYDEGLRCNYHDIYDNIYEELADVIIMMIQFIYKNKIPHQDLLDEISKKLIRYYETISDKK